MIWNIILTFSVCIVLALLLDASIVMLGRDVYDKISKDEKRRLYKCYIHIDLHNIIDFGIC